MDPYAILGVPHDATPEDIKQAYRKKAKGAHPDTAPDGGQAFYALKAAYDLLRDPDRRAFYDQTGVADIAQTPDGAVLSQVANALMKIITAEQFDPAHHDLLGLARQVIQNEMIAPTDSNIAKLTGLQDRLQRSLKRLRHKVDEDSSALALLLERNLATITAEREKQERERAVFTKMLERLEDYQYDFEAMVGTPYATRPLGTFTPFYIKR
jgi:curved DNA-binding protein CbpA